MFGLGKREIRTPAICVSVIGDDAGIMRNRLKKAVSRGADVVELRLDKLNSFDNWTELISEETPMIATNRCAEEGGFFEGREEERVETLVEALESDVEAVDLELSADEELSTKVLNEANESEASVILSHHDFEKVPSRGDMLDRAEEMEGAGADIAKTIGYANDSQDALKMLDFLIQVPERVDIPVVAFAMGEKGKFTRVAAPLLGSPITYASIEEKAAPGQLDLEQVRKILEKYRE